LGALGEAVLFKKFERYAFVVLLFATLSCLIVGVYSLIADCTNSGKWLASSGLLTTATGVFQLEISGLFKRIMELYDNEEKFPYGPPSYLTRQVIDNPDRPFAMWVRNTCFFNVATGFWLIIVGTFVQILAVWV
jgi:hypothetical protein